MNLLCPGSSNLCGRAYDISCCLSPSDSCLCGGINGLASDPGDSEKDVAQHLTWINLCIMSSLFYGITGFVMLGIHQMTSPHKNGNPLVLTRRFHSVSAFMMTGFD